MKKITQTFGYLGSTMLAAALLSWICVFLFHGLPGVYVWMALKFIIPILGFVGPTPNPLADSAHDLVKSEAIFPRSYPRRNGQLQQL